MTALDYERLARQHRPTDQAALAREIRRLYADGLKPRDIAAALRFDLPAVLTALQPHLERTMSGIPA
jgi:hypothetical protein